MAESFNPFYSLFLPVPSAVVQSFSICHAQSSFSNAFNSASNSHHLPRLLKAYYAKIPQKTYLPVSDASDAKMSGCLLWILWMFESS